MLVECEKKDVYLSIKGFDKQCVSVLATISASVWVLSPLVVYPYERL